MKFASVVQTIGLLFIAAAVALFDVRLGLGVAGLLAVLAGVALERR